jgi:cytochrome c-type biogenesis protein CcmE
MAVAKTWIKIAISSGVAGVAIFVMAYSISRSSGVYMKVDQLVKESSRWKGKEIWVGGQLVDGSHKYRRIQGSAAERHRFEVEWKGARIAVEYTGSVPSGFIPGQQITLKGRLMKAGLFKAVQVTTKCPSKYKSRE